MSRFDELNKLFAPWQDSLHAQYRAHQALPAFLAKGFQEFLGCPEIFSDVKTSKDVKYVSPADARWAAEENHFYLTAYDDPFTIDVNFHEDGFFYFGLRIFLEKAANVYPKQEFWRLLRAKFNEIGFTVWEQSSGTQFNLGPRGVSTIELFECLFESLRSELMRSPNIAEAKSPNKIGLP